MKKFAILLVGLFPLTQVTGQTTEGLRKINGTHLYVKITGEGDPLLIVHGGPGLNHSYFLPYLERLSKKSQVIFFDQRASGKSVTPSSDSITLDFFVEDIEAIRKELKLEKITILGHSWGILPSVRYAIKYPNKVNGLVFCNAVALSKEFDGEIASLAKKKATSKDSTDRSILLGSQDFKKGEVSAYKKLLLLSFRNSFYHSQNTKSLNLELPLNYKDASKTLFMGLGKELADYNYYDELSKFQFPVLILHGSADLLPLAALQRVTQTVRDGKLVVFKKSGHFVFVEEPKKFTAVMSTFLSKSAR